MQPKILKRPRPMVLIILDGFGLAPPYIGNSVTNGELLVFNRLMQGFAHGQLHASGSAVGLPHNIIGNSEVGHINIGAGSIVFQTLPRINSAITNETYYINETILEGIEHCKKNNSNFHIMGLASNGNVHSTLEHLFATFTLIEKAKFNKSKVFIHCFTDGRDTSPDSGVNFLKQIDAECEKRGFGGIVSIIGRYFAMDRNNKWERTKKAYDLLVEAKGERYNSSEEAVRANYSQGITDEFIEPSVVLKDGHPVTVEDNDALFFYNYRSDRAVQISKAIIEPKFDFFDRKPFQNLFYIGMTQYDKSIKDEMKMAFPPEEVGLPLGRVIAENAMRQLRLAETEKFPHVTYFFNGGKEIVFTGEDRVLVPSPKVATYDLKPEMSSFELAQVLVNKARLKLYDFMLLNFAAPDMVGHTGNYDAVINAVKAVDKCLDKILINVLSLGGACMIIGDHGNCEVMVDLETSKPHTEHTTNPVPWVYIGQGSRAIEVPIGSLRDVAPTVLNLMQLEVPISMNGRNLLEGIL